MTESEWLSLNDPAPMLDAIPSFASFRKLRLFGCGCCRRAWGLLGEKDRSVVEAVERVADGEVPFTNVYAAAGVPDPSTQEELVPGPPLSQVAHELASARNVFDIKRVRAFVIDRIRAADRPGSRATELAWQASALRCVFGNPFRLCEFRPEWRTETTLGLAAAMYESHEFGAMPVLADALEEAGCDDRGILHHCRDEGQAHTRGCFVVDELLGNAERVGGSG